MDRGKEQALGCVDVADADDAASVHEKLLDRGAVSARERMQAPAVERAGERLDAQMADQRMLPRRLLRPKHRAEAARVAQAQQLLADGEVEMVVLAGGRSGGDHAQAA